MLNIKELSYSYNNKKILNSISFAIEKKSIIGILGKNGCGKTTLFNCIQGIRTDYQGSIRVLGYEAKERNSEMLSQIGVQLQSNTFFNKIKIHELFKFVAALYDKEISMDRITSLLSKVNMQEEYNSFISKLSGGQKQRVSLALSIMNNPSILFLDEPTVGLDVQSRLELWNAIKHIHNHGTTIVLTTHYMQEIENICNRVIVLNKGNLILDKQTDEILSNLKFKKKIYFDFVKNNINTQELKNKLEKIHKSEVKIIISDTIMYIQANKTEQIIGSLKEIYGEDYNIDITIQNVNLEDVFMDLTEEK